MDLANASAIDVIAALIALFSLWVAVRALSRTSSNDLFSLQQSVRLQAEVAQSGWYRLRNENEAAIQRVNLIHPRGGQAVEALLKFLQSQQEVLNSNILDAAAMATDVHKNSARFGEKKCQEYLRMMEPSIEKMNRSQGVTERKVGHLLDKLAQHDSNSTSGPI